MIRIPHSDYRSWFSTGRERGDHGRRRWQRRPAMAVAWCATMLLSSGLLWALSWYQPTRPVAVALVGAGYQENLAVPHNAYGWSGLESLTEFDSHETFRVSHEPWRLQPRFDWAQVFAAADKGTLLLFVSAHGGADSQGPFLLVENASRLPKQRLRLDRLFTELAKLPAERPKVVCFDSTQLAHDWRLGMLHNDFARGLAALDARIREIPNLVVICASEVDQRSWVCEQWGNSVFAEYFRRGLQGGAEDEDRDGRISVLELHRWLTRRVSRWTASHRNAQQIPLLLPSDDTGEQRAERIEIAALSSPPPRSIPLEFTPPAELNAAWERFDSRMKRSPPDFAYTPGLWREYAERLIRYEALLRAGDYHHAGRMLETLTSVEQEMDRVRAQPIASVQNSLSLQSLGESASFPREQGTQLLNEIWDASPPGQSKAWTKALRGCAGPGDRQRLRLAVQTLILDRVSEDPLDNLQQAADIARLVASPLYPLPAEIHLLVMLAEHLPEGSDGAEGRLIRRALQLRRLGEQVAVARDRLIDRPEVAALWCSSIVEQGDTARRQAEDLLFAGKGESPVCQQFLAKAEECYERARRVAKSVHHSISVRDRVLALLPYYSQWLATAASDPPNAGSRQQDLAVHAESLWRETHQLVAMLERPRPESIDAPLPATAETTQTLSLIERCQQVESDFNKLVERYDELLKAIANDEVATDWRTTDALLRVPHADGPTRMAVLMRTRRMTHKMLTDRYEERPFGESGYPEHGLGSTRERATCSAHWQGRLALSELGEQLFEVDLPGDRESYQQVRHRLDLFRVEENWWRSVRAAGSEIATRLLTVPEQIVDSLAGTEEAEVGKRRSALIIAERLARQLDGAEHSQLAEHPAILLRQVRMHDLLLSQAERTVRDRWFDRNPAGEPYFRRAAEAYLSDAQRFYPLSPPVVALRKELDEVDELRFLPLSPINLTSETNVQLEYELAPMERQVPEGFVASWLGSEPGLTIASPKPHRRILRKLGGHDQGGPIGVTLACPRLRNSEREGAPVPIVESGLRIHGFFRGQSLEARVPIQLHLRPERVVRQPPLPNAASISVATAAELQHRYGAGEGAVALVLDCSGSMGPQSEETHESKYAEAVAALHSVLRQLPPGTQISLWTFGEAVGPTRTASAETTIRQVHAPMRWDGTASQLRQFMERIEPGRVIPWNESPLVRTILAAKEDLADARGFRTIIAITDGMDNRFAHDRAANPQGNSIREALRAAFDGTEISLNIVGFKVQGDEADTARRQFTIVREFSLPGAFYEVEAADALAETLEIALRRRLQFELDGFAATGPATLQEGGLLDSSQVWPPQPVSPGVYKLRCVGEPSLDAELLLQKGDVLALTAESVSGELRIRRHPYAQQRFPGRPFAERDGWRSTLLHCQATAASELRTTVAIERQVDAFHSYLTQTTPRTVWFEVAAKAASEEPTAISWQRVLGFPMPVWRIAAADWPVSRDTQAMVSPDIRVWWMVTGDPPFAGTRLRETRAADFSELEGTVVRAADNAIQITSIAVEQHWVHDAAGGRSLQSCLVVRLQHPNDEIFWARPMGCNIPALEHRFYPSIGGYTGLFWPISEEQAARELEGVAVISLDEFQREAEQRGDYLELSELEVPTANTPSPTPTFSFD